MEEELIKHKPQPGSGRQERFKISSTFISMYSYKSVSSVPIENELVPGKTRGKRNVPKRSNSYLKGFVFQVKLQ